jgi:hypothetical protein
MLLSVCILMKDDARQLARMAAMVSQLADEILVVCDDPVSNEFRETAAQCGARLAPHRWEQDFAAARNAGLDAARGEWVFWIDTDETLLAPGPEEIRELLRRPDVLAHYVTIEDLAGPATMSLRQHPSIYRHHKEIRYAGRVHEHFARPLEELAAERGMTVSSAPIRLQHTGYEPQVLPRKLERNIVLLELELKDRPGQLYYLIELGRSLLLAGHPRGHAVLTEAAQVLQHGLGASRPPIPLAAALLEYALSHAPAGFPLSPQIAAATAERWFASSPPLVWRRARWHYSAGQFAEAASLLERLLAMGSAERYDDALSFDRRILGDEARLNLGVCYAKLGKRHEAVRQLRLIQPGGAFSAMAQTNIQRLGGMAAGAK